MQMLFAKQIMAKRSNWKQRFVHKSFTFLTGIARKKFVEGRLQEKEGEVEKKKELSGKCKWFLLKSV